jgi:hypothetical protein
MLCRHTCGEEGAHGYTSMAEQHAAKCSLNKNAAHQLTMTQAVLLPLPLSLLLLLLLLVPLLLLLLTCQIHLIALMQWCGLRLCHYLLLLLLLHL